MQLPNQPREFSLWIDGQAAASSEANWIERESPGHAVPVTRVPAGAAADVDRAVAAAKAAFEQGPWPWTASSGRATILADIAKRIRAAEDELAYWETLESGKPISQARAEVEWTAGLWEYAAALSRHLYGDSCNTLGQGMLGMTLRDPIGVVGLITPWNFPLLIISQKLPFALAAGCACVIKPSEMTSATTLLLAEICAAAGVPNGVINVITGYGEPVGRRIAEHDDVDMVSFTGSTTVGKDIVRASAGNLKKVSLELGGKNPMIVFDDAALESAVEAARLGAFFNMGQCCNSSSRILVQAGIAERFREQLVTAAAELPLGDPLNDATKLGAIINDRQQEKILDYIQSGKQAGAHVALGGETLADRPGRFIQPTVLDGVMPDMSIAREEIFGPVLSLIQFTDREEAIRIANGTPYGLSAAVWTQDYDTALSVTRQLRAGTIWVNTWLEGNAEMSFGGFKQSGLGRELGRSAVEEFTEPKSVQMQIGPRTTWW